MRGEAEIMKGKEELGDGSFLPSGGLQASKA